MENSEEIISIVEEELNKESLPPRGRIVYMQMQSVHLFKLLKKTSSCTQEQFENVFTTICAAVELAKVELQCGDGEKILN